MKLHSRSFSALTKFSGRCWLLITRRDFWHFAAVYVETGQHCNRGCSYCPQSISALPKAFMSDEDFQLVRGRLVEHGWRGMVVLSRFNEPLLDPKIAERVADLRRIGCKPQMFSNGDRLTPALAEKLVDAGLDVCKLTRHEPTSDQWARRIGHVIERFPKHFKLMTPVVPYMIGGLNEEAKAWTSCSLPSWALIINYDLRVSLCCHDYARDHVFGSLKTQTIGNVWRGGDFKRVRKSLRYGKPEFTICKGCFGDKKAIQKIHDNLTASNVPSSRGALADPLGICAI